MPPAQAPPMFNCIVPNVGYISFCSRREEGSQSFRLCLLAHSCDELRQNRKREGWPDCSPSINASCNVLTFVSCSSSKRSPCPNNITRRSITTVANLTGYETGKMISQGDRRVFGHGSTPQYNYIPIIGTMPSYLWLSRFPVNEIPFRFRFQCLRRMQRGNALQHWPCRIPARRR